MKTKTRKAGKAARGRIGARGAARGARRRTGRPTTQLKAAEALHEQAQAGMPAPGTEEDWST